MRTAATTFKIVSTTIVAVNAAPSHVSDARLFRRRYATNILTQPVMTTHATNVSYSLFVFDSTLAVALATESQKLQTPRTAHIRSQQSMLNSILMKVQLEEWMV
ncbi:hypothetical protein C8R46DRAFT_1105978 [Mycena filopes]|nr:hypothetical protein C8R46DRAFT_1105978 [Mycena filopes]